MDKREYTRQITDLAQEIEEKDLVVEDINRLMNILVGDNVTSSLGQMVFILNPHENVLIHNYQMAVLPPTQPLDEENPEPMLAGAMGIQFVDPMTVKHTYGSSVTVTHTLLIRAMENLKKDMMRSQVQLDKKLDKLVAAKNMK